MLTKSPSINRSHESRERQNAQPIKSDALILKSLIENFVDGILILTEQGELVQENTFARQICNQLTKGKKQLSLVPKEIWCVCRALLASRSAYPNQPMIVESEIATDQSTTIRIRTQWLKSDAITTSYLLVILEDRYQSSQSLAIAEVDRYGLTPREAQVWLLRRANYSRKDIAAQLYISVDTVKKHLKSIHAKQEAALDREVELAS